MDIDQAHRKGHIYRKTPLSWACTAHGGAMRSRRGSLVASCCGLTVEETPTPTVAA